MNDDSDILDCDTDKGVKNKNIDCSQVTQSEAG